MSDGLNLTTLIDYNGGTNAVYVGTASPGASPANACWTIKMLTYDGNNNVTQVAFAGAPGQAVSQQIWNNRASLLYS